MGKINYLNIGCGNKYHEDWFNIDKYSNSRHVIACDLYKGINFDDKVFDVVYMSQVLEHFPRKKAPELISECRRVLKNGGTIRIVVPNLEDIAKNYLKLLAKNLYDPTDESVANYDWMLLEMYDQDIRNISGGEMAEFLKKTFVINEEFILSRIGFEGKRIRDNYIQEQQGSKMKLVKDKILKAINSKNRRKVFNYVKRKITGRFRLDGEIHYWMYDRYSLKRLLENCGFKDIEVKTPFDSDIQEWNKYELDVKSGQAYDPASLFMEAKK